VLYQSTASMSPAPKSRNWLQTIGRPWRTVSLSLFFAFHRVTGAHSERYPCAAMRDTTPWAGDANEAMLARVLSPPPPLSANDGIVPIRSQVWGTLAWVGHGDHLDVLGHYRDARDPDTVAPELRHRDWLASASDFTDADFGALMDAIADGMLSARA
jgi:hypothetical protein